MISQQPQARRQTGYQVPDWLLDSSPSVENHAREVQDTIQEILNDLQQGVQQKPRTIEIGQQNTTIIGDYVASVFADADAKWKKQMHGNATWSSVLNGIQQGDISVQFWYIFLMVGHNQIRSASRAEIVLLVQQTVMLIREINEEARIFVSAILPRPVDNEIAKPFIVNFNRWLVLAMNKISKSYYRVHFLPVQHHFLTNGLPTLHLFNEDKFTLNPRGAALLKATLFKLAGFKRNQ